MNTTLNQRDRTERETPSGFTLIEMLVVISIITMLISFLLPSLSKAKVTAKRTMCASQVRQMTLANTQYMDDYKDVFPPHRDLNLAAGPNWHNLLEKYGNNPDLSRCPELGGPQIDNGVTWQWNYDFNYIGYGYNGFFLGLYSHAGPQNSGTYITSNRWMNGNRVKDTTKLIVFADSHPKSNAGVNHGVSLTLWWPYINRFTEGINARRHQDAGIVGFADNHAEIVFDPENTIQPSVDGSPDFIEYWDPLQRRP